MDALGFNVLSFIIYVLLFIGMYFVLSKFLLPSLTKSIDERKKLLSDNLKLKSEIEEHKVSLDNEAKEKEQELLKKAQTQADDIIAQANNEAKATVENAKEKSKTMLNEVRELIAKKQKTA